MTLSLAELNVGVKRRRMYFQSVGGITNMLWLYILSVSELPAVNLVLKNCRSWKCSWSRTEIDINPLSFYPLNMVEKGIAKYPSLIKRAF